MTSPESSAPPGASVPAPRPRRLAIALLAVVTLATGALLAASAGVALRPVPTVTVHPVLFDHAEPDGAADEPSQTLRTVQAPGWIEPDPYSVAATALTDGVIDEILALEGESVRAGQVVATLVRDDAELGLARARAELAAAEAGAANARATLHAAETEWNEPTERARAVAVARATLARIDAEIAQLPALLQAENARADQLAEELARTELALRSGAANEIESIVARKRLDAARATAEALARRGPILGAHRDAARADLAAAERHAELRTAERLALDGARAELARAEAALARAAAARDEAALRLERTEIRAPISGLVQSRFKYPGSKVMAGMDDPHSNHVLHLYDPDRLQVRADVPLADAAGIRVGRPCEVVAEILPDRTFRAVVTRVTNQADLQKNTLQIKVRIIDPDPALKPEMLARVRFLGAGNDAAGGAPGTRALIVPEAAISERDGGAIVHAVRQRRADTGRLVTVPVTIVSRSGGWAGVRAELHPGDLIALDPPADAGRVRITLAEDPS